MPKITEPILAGAIGLTPEDAVKYFESKGFAITWDWKAQVRLNNAQAFTVAKAMKMDVLMDIRGMIDKAIKEGLPFETFKKELKPMLQARGWWGKKEVTGPDGRKVVQLGSPHRLRTIYETNTQSSYNAGRWRGQEANKKFRPYLKYVTVGDAAVRVEHAALNDTIKPVDSPFWNTYYPPNGYNCRCSIESLTVEEKNKEGGITKGIPRFKDPETKTMKIAKPDQGFRQNAGKKTLAFKPKKEDYDSDIWKIAQPVTVAAALSPLLKGIKKQEPDEEN